MSAVLLVKLGSIYFCWLPSTANFYCLDVTFPIFIHFLPMPLQKKGCSNGTYNRLWSTEKQQHVDKYTSEKMIQFLLHFCTYVLPSHFKGNNATIPWRFFRLYSKFLANTWDCLLFKYLMKHEPVYWPSMYILNLCLMWVERT